MTKYTNTWGVRAASWALWALALGACGTPTLPDGGQLRSLGNCPSGEVPPGMICCDGDVGDTAYCIGGVVYCDARFHRFVPSSECVARSRP